MADFAVIKTGGKQYKVKVGDSINVEKLEVADKEGKIELADIFGGKKVTAKITGNTKGPKIRVIKFHSKKRYQRTLGHRQKLTSIKIEEIK